MPTVAPDPDAASSGLNPPRSPKPSSAQGIADEGGRPSSSNASIDGGTGTLLSSATTSQEQDIVMFGGSAASGGISVTRSTSENARYTY